MSDFFAQARVINDKLNKTQEDWKEMVRLYLAAAEKRIGLNAISIADCYSWSGDIMLNCYEEKTPEMYNEALRVLKMVETVPGLPNWYGVLDNQFLARIAPMSFGYDPSQVETGDSALIDGIVERMVRQKGSLETANGLANLLHKSIFAPVYAGKSKSFSENSAAISAIDKMIQLVWGSLEYIPIGEQGFTCKGLLNHYCKPKTRESFDAAVASYKAAINKITLIQYGASCAYTHLIDLLERSEFHGFAGCVDKEAALADAAKLRAERDAWYRTDPSRRLMYWESQMILNADWVDTVFCIFKPTPAMIEHAVKLGETVQQESNSNLIKLQAAAVVGQIYHHRMPATKENLRRALEHYRRVFELDPGADGTLGTDFTFVNMTLESLINANSHRMNTTVRKVLHEVLPLCFFPKRSGHEELPSDELAQFQDFLARFAVTMPNHLSAQNVARCFEEYKSFVKRVDSMLANSKPAIQDDVFIQSKVAEIGTSVVENSGTSGGEEKVKEKEQELKTTTEIVESFYRDIAMAQFYIGFSRTFSEIYVSSMAVTSGTIAIHLDNLAVSASSLLLSMVPLIGGVAPTLLETGYNQYTTIKLKSSAEMMVTAFPLDSLMNETVLQVLRKVQTELAAELNELEKDSSKIMGGLLEQLSGQLESLKSLIAKQRSKSDLEKLAAQVAMEVIEKLIYSGKMPRYASPAQTTQLLTQETMRVIMDIKANFEALEAKKQAKKATSTIEESPVTESVSPNTPVSAEDVCPSVPVVKTGCARVIS